MAGKLKKGKRCSSACITKDHRTFGECMRSKNLNVSNYLADNSANKQNDAELKAYRDARAQGIQPAGTTMNKVREAVEISNATGKAFNADSPF